MFANELGRLAQDVGKIFKGPATIFFVDYKNFLSENHKDITYGCIVVEYHLLKKELKRTRLRVRGNIIE